MQIRFHREARKTPEAIDGLKVPYAAAKRSAPKWRWRLILLAVLSPAILLAYSAIQSMVTLSANGTVFLMQHEVRAPAHGRVFKILARLGAEVRKGELIAQLHDADLDASISIFRQVHDSDTPSTAPPDQSLLREELALQERVLRTQEERAQAIEQLLKEGAATAAELREARLAVDQAQASILRSRQQLSSGTARKLAQPTNSVARQGELKRLLAKREALAIKAPEGGRIIDVLTAEGQFVSAGEPLLVLGRGEDPQVIAYVSPEIAPKLSIGSRATIKFPDGSKTQATVAEQPMLTRRMPADLVDQFGLRPMTVVLHLQADHAWPAGQIIHGLPVTVRFHYRWEAW